MSSTGNMFNINIVLMFLCPSQASFHLKSLSPPPQRFTSVQILVFYTLREQKNTKTQNPFPAEKKVFPFYQTEWNGREGDSLQTPAQEGAVDQH